jgi:sulfonate transport system permease protein
MRRRRHSGFAAGAVLRTVLGALAGYSEQLKRIWDDTLQAIRSVPIIAWVPLFILWLGIQETSKITLISLGAFFLVYLNTMTGIASVDRKLLEVGRVNRMSGLRLIREVYLPATWPSYLVGLRVGLGLSWMFESTGELLGASQGIGYLLVERQTKGRPELIIASIIVFAVCGKTTDFIMSAVSKRLTSWQDTEKKA